jgi:phosphohistidine phosphatase SixA
MSDEARCNSSTGKLTGAHAKRDWIKFYAFLAQFVFVFPVTSRPTAGTASMRLFMLGGVLALVLGGGLADLALPAGEAGVNPPQVLLIHHATADQGTDEADVRFGDCATQRNLSAAGRLEAERMGARLSEHGYLVSKVLVSPFCRTMQTAMLMRLRPIEVSAAFQNIRGDGSDPAAAARLGAARKILQSWRGPGVLVIVTHSSILKALTGLEPPKRKFMVYSNPARRAGAGTQQAAAQPIELRTF